MTFSSQHPNPAPQCQWSVMIPAYNADEQYLEATLRSVLAQDPGEASMQIEVIDDASPKGSAEELVRRLAGERIKFHHEPKNLGLAAIWNRCVERAHGAWVHILHQDDIVLPGFYAKLAAGTESPDKPGLVFCRQAFIDGNGQVTGQSALEAEKAGWLPHALPRLARAQAIQTPSVVVRRSVYAEIGGFRQDLCFTLDWEMWCRIARQYPVWYEPEILAQYRVHGAAETSRLTLSGRDIADVRKCIDIISGYVSDPGTRAEVRRSALRRNAMFAMKNAETLAKAGQRTAAWRQIIGALQCDFSPGVIKDLLTVLPAALGFMKNSGHSLHP